MYINFTTKTHNAMLNLETGRVIATDKHPRMTARQDYDFNINDELNNPSVEQKAIVDAAKKLVIKITKVNDATYEVEKNGNKAIVKYNRNGRYDIYDGKYYPAWLFSYEGKDFVCNDKQHAMEMAAKRL